MLSALPARYAKFLASLFGQAVLFSQLSGGFRHITLTEALTAVGVSLGVLAVPNASKTAKAHSVPTEPGSALVKVSQQELDTLRSKAIGK
jgi:hypothetical protein